MDADPGSLIRIKGGYGGTVEKESTVLITRDFLGGSSLSGTQELDLEMVVPSGYEKCLDLKSGKLYLQRCSPPNSATSSSSSSSSEHKHQTSQTKLQGMDFHPSSSKTFPNHFGGTSLDLKLFSTLTASTPPSCNYQSVCTLDKVKYALERTEKASNKRKWSHSWSPTSPSSSSIKETEESHQPAELFAAGCPYCLLYVMISRSNPICPKCHAIVPPPALTSYKTVAKKPGLDLNNISV